MKKTLFLLPIGFLLLYFLGAYIAYTFFIRLGSDFLSYTQAFDLIRLDNFNPIIPTRGLHILNDHFDPILIPFALLSSFLNPTILAFIVEFLFISTFLFTIYILYRRGRLNEATTLFIFIYFIFNFGTIKAIANPVHPTTWSILPILGTIYYYGKNQFSISLIFLVFLFSCKEEFVFSGFMFAIYCLIKKEFRRTLILSLISLIWAWIIFKGRYLLWDNETIHYGKELLSPFLSNPIYILFHYYSDPLVLWRHLFIFHPILIILYLFKKNYIPLKEINYLPILMLLPVYGVRVITGRAYFFDRFYLIPIIAFIISFVIINQRNFNFSLHKKWYVFYALFVVLSNINIPGQLDKSPPYKTIEENKVSLDRIKSNEVSFGHNKTTLNDFKQSNVELITGFDKNNNKTEIKIMIEKLVNFYHFVILRKNEIWSAVSYVRDQSNSIVYTSDDLLVYLNGNNIPPYWLDYWIYTFDPVILNKAIFQWEEQGFRKQIWRNPNRILPIIKEIKKYADKEIIFFTKEFSPKENVIQYWRQNAKVIKDNDFVFIAEKIIKK